MDYDYGLYDGDPMDGESYYYEDDEDENELPSMTLDQIIQLCLKPTLYDSIKMVSGVFIWCFVYRLLKSFTKNSDISQQIISIVLGCLCLHSIFSTSMFHIISLMLLTYALLFMLSYFQLNCGVFLILSSLVYTSICELWLVDLKQWHHIRGSQMLVIMKSVSLAFDLDLGTVKKVPNIIFYSGYILSPGSCVFGPWISFNDYIFNYTEKWSFKYVTKILRSLLLAVLFLTISTCWSMYFIPGESWKWLTAYKVALSFRSSHYFICYLSNVTLLLSGYSDKEVTRPHLVEFPRSVVNVVIYWNIPMHNWLKTYIFNTSKRLGNLFAVFTTYIVSSLLHGINFQLSAVLLSLGAYSYIEVILRKKLASAFNACILAKKCKGDCSHGYKSHHPPVFLTNSFLVLLTMFHLAYLGVVFESSSQEEEVGYSWRHSLKKWASLNYLSPCVALLTYLMYFLIK